MTWTKELDEATILATKRGYWHTLLFWLLCALAGIPTSFLVFSQVFTNATPEHWCAASPELSALGLNENDLKHLTVPRTADNTSYEQCLMYDIQAKDLFTTLVEYVDERSEVVTEGGVLRVVKIYRLKPIPHDAEQLARVQKLVLSIRGTEPVACKHGWRYSAEHYERTLVTQFDLVCSKDWWPRTSNILFWVGSIFGNLFFGWMSDRYGRRPTILLMILLEVPLSIAASFSSDYIVYTGLRVVCGLFFPALYQLPFILALELMPPSKRTYTGIVVGMLFAGGMCLLSLLAYCIRDWYWLSLATSLPFISLYSYFWLIPESPRWLVGRGRIAEAEKVLWNLAKKNGIELRRGFLLELHKRVKEEEEEAEATMLSNINGHVLPEKSATDDSRSTDRKMINLLTFKPDLNNISETATLSTTPNLERIIALEVADVVNKKCAKKENDTMDTILKKDRDDINLLGEQQQKSTQTDPYKSSGNTLRRKSIQMVTKFFHTDEEDEVDKKMDDQNSEGDGKASPLDIFRYPNIRKKFFILTFDWVALGVVYNSLSYNTPNLGVDDYLAFFIGGVVELPSYCIAWRCMDKFGRRWVLFAFMSVGGVACLSCVLIPESSPWVTVCLAMLGRLCAAASFAVFYVLIGELLPTVLRAQAMGAASFLSGLGLLACPYIVHLAVYFKALPLCIMGVLSVAGGMASLFLPETLRRPLPQTLSDAELFGRNFKILSCVENTKCGVVELPSYCIAWRCMDKFGRRWVLFAFMSVGGVACLSCVLIPESSPWVTVCLAMLGRLCAAASFAVFYVLIGELLPTVLRAQAMGAASFLSGLGLLACPYIVHLAVYFKALPLCIMGVLSVAGGMASLFLPETLRRPLPQTLSDAELFGRNFKILSCVENTKCDA